MLQGEIGIKSKKGWSILTTDIKRAYLKILSAIQKFKMSLIRHIICSLEGIYKRSKCMETHFHLLFFGATELDFEKIDSPFKMEDFFFDFFS